MYAECTFDDKCFVDLGAGSTFFENPLQDTQMSKQRLLM